MRALLAWLRRLWERAPPIERAPAPRALDSAGLSRAIATFCAEHDVSEREVVVYLHPSDAYRIFSPATNWLPFEALTSGLYFGATVVFIDAHCTPGEPSFRAPPAGRSAP